MVVARMGIPNGFLCLPFSVTVSLRPLYATPSEQAHKTILLNLTLVTLMVALRASRYIRFYHNFMPLDNVRHGIAFC